MPNMDNSHPNKSWIPSTIIASLIIFMIMLFGWKFSEKIQDAMLTEVILALGISFGWILGTYLTPDTKVEANNLSQAFKGISIFVTGFLTSKLDRVIETLFTPEIFLQDALVLYRFIGFIAIMSLSAIGVYFLRRYCFGLGE